MAEHYPYDMQYQAMMLATLMQNADLVGQCRPLISAEYFESDDHMLLADMVLKYFDRFDKLPNRIHVKNELKMMWSSGRLNVERFDAVIKLAGELYRVITDSDSVFHNVRRFGRHQLYKAALLNSTESLRKEDYDHIHTMLDEAYAMSNDDNMLGHLYIAERNDREVIDKNTVHKPAKTMWSRVDGAIKHGGLDVGQVGVIAGAPKRGKTSMLVNLGAVQVELGKKVIHYTMELSELLIRERYDARIGHITLSQVDDCPVELMTKLSLIAQREGEVVIKHYPPNTAGIMNFRAHMKLLRSMKQFEPDLVLVDYLKLMNPKRVTDSSYDNLGNCVTELRALSEEFNVPIWTAAQLRRDSLSKAVTTEEDLAESFAIAMDADLLMTICQTVEERQNHQMRIHITASRIGPSGVAIPFTFDTDRMTIREVSQ